MELLSNAVELTSLQLAEITGKEHKNILRDIKDEMQKLENAGEKGLSIFELSSYTNSQNKEQPMYKLNKEGVMQISMRYSAVIRRRVVVKLIQLESVTSERKEIFKLENERMKIVNERMKLENVKLKHENDKLRLEIRRDELNFKINKSAASTKDLKVATQILKSEKEKMLDKMIALIKKEYIKEKPELISNTPTKFFMYFLENIDGFSDIFKNVPSLSMYLQAEKFLNFKKTKTNGLRKWVFDTKEIF